MTSLLGPRLEDGEELLALLLERRNLALERGDRLLERGDLGLEPGAGFVGVGRKRVAAERRILEQRARKEFY